METAKKQDIYTEQATGSEAERLYLGDELKSMSFHDFMEKSRKEAREILARYDAELAEDSEDEDLCPSGAE